ncbi:MAG: DUF2946 domain-containing protein [Gammaproteobacteria bacterium]|nr:DUF2946 domain-containing protein [Gammaproteobacteria bacterium]
MSRLTRKFVAILMLLWLPLSASSALAATVSMQMHDACHDMTMPTMQHQTTGNHHAAAQHSAPCSTCGACHLACSGYLATPPLELASLQFEGRLDIPYLVAFTSITTAPLDPPPLART